MSTKKLTAAAFAALLAFPISGMAQQSAGTLMRDSAITAKIKAAQAADSTVRATRIDVETDNNGVVTLTGTARSQAEIDRAVELARGVDGVTAVNNNMTLSGNAASGSGTSRPSTTDGASGSGSSSGMTSPARPLAPRRDRN